MFYVYTSRQHTNKTETKKPATQGGNYRNGRAGSASLFERKQTQMEDEQTNEETTAEEQTDGKDEDMGALIAQMKADHEAELAKQKQEYEKRLAERNKVIKQLVKGDSKEATPRDAIDERLDKINQRRERVASGKPLLKKGN